MLQRAAGNTAVSQAMPALAAGPGNEDVLAEVGRQQQAIEVAAALAAERVDRSVTERRADLAGVFAAQQAQADRALASFDERATTDTAAHTQTATTAAGTARQDIRGQADNANQATDQRVSGLADEAQQHANIQADTAMTSATGRIGSISTRAAAADADVAAGQQRIGDAVTGKAHTELGKSGSDTAGLIRARATQRRGILYDSARTQADDEIRTTARQTDAAITDGLGTATQAIQQTGSQARTSARAAHRTVTDALRTGQQSTESDLATWAEQAKEHISANAQRLTTAIAEQGGQLAAVVGNRPADKAVAAMQAAGDESIGAITDTADGLDAGVSELADSHGVNVSGVGGQVVQGMAQMGAATAETLGRHSAAFTQQTDHARTAATAEFGQAAARAGNALAAEHAKGITEQSGAVDRAADAETAWTTSAGQRSQDGSTRFAEEADRLGQQAQQEPVQRLFDGLINRMRNWLRSKLGNVLGGIVSGIILSLPAIAIGVALLFAGPVGWVVLAGLLIVGAGFGIYGRYKDYQHDHGGQGPSGWDLAGVIALGVADITGIPYIVEAGVGRRAFSATPMSTFERWERGTQGVVNLALLVAGGAKKLFGEGGTGGEGLTDTPTPGTTSVDSKPPTDTPAPDPAGGDQAQPGKASMTKSQTALIRQMESGKPVDFTPEYAEALRTNADLASQKWLKIYQNEGRVPWDSIRNQLNLTRWRFLPRAPEAAQLIRNALMRLPEGPERTEMLGLLDKWLGSGGGNAGGAPVPVPAPDHDENDTE